MHPLNDNLPVCSSFVIIAVNNFIEILKQKSNTNKVQSKSAPLIQKYRYKYGQEYKKAGERDQIKSSYQRKRMNKTNRN